MTYAYRLDIALEKTFKKIIIDWNTIYKIYIYELCKYKNQYILNDSRRHTPLPTHLGNF